MIAVVTDSASMLPTSWAHELGIGVAPMTIVVDGVAHQEGVDLDSAHFYRRLADGAVVSTSTPSPGEVLRRFEEALGAGAHGIVSVHTGSEYSAVLDAARLAVRELDAPVELVDTHTASFPVALCVVAAARAARHGADLAGAAAAARDAAAVVDSTFVLGVPELARRSGRLGDTPVPTATTVLTLGPAGLAEHAQADDLDHALELMRAHVQLVAGAGTPLRVGVGDADRQEVGDRLAELLAGADGIAELVRYEVGPSVGAHSGAGTVGAVWAPA